MEINQPVCNSCGEKAAESTMPDPNGGVVDWDVCLDCKEGIRRMQGMGMELLLAHRLKERGMSHESEESIIKKYGFEEVELTSQ